VPNVTITDHHLSILSDSLSNDDISSDEEMCVFWKNNGIPDELAKTAILLREQFLENPRSEIVLIDGVLHIR